MELELLLERCIEFNLASKCVFGTEIDHAGMNLRNETIMEPIMQTATQSGVWVYVVTAHWKKSYLQKYYVSFNV